MIHHVFANRSNAGDWLAARGIQKLLGRNDVREHLCDEPFVPDTLSALGEAGSSDMIVIGGGGLFMDYFMPFWEGFRPISRRVPFCIWGVGVCDMRLADSLPPVALIEEIAARARLCVVRDELTRSFLSRLRLPPSVACPTMNAVTATSEETGGVMLHVDHYDNVGPEVFEFMERCAADLAARTGRRHRKTNNTLSAGSEGALAEILALYRSADLVLTSRLHGCIIAAALGRPFLAVSGDRKVDSFMAAAGLEEWLCPIEDVDTLPRRLAALDRDRPLAGGFVERTRRENTTVAEHVSALVGASR